MITVTKLQRDNAISAKEMWLTIPEAKVMPGLLDYTTQEDGRSAPTCDTLACFGGWCAWWPAFQEQGVTSNSDGKPVQANGRVDLSVCSMLFGVHDLFSMRGLLEADQLFNSVYGQEYGEPSDWQVVMNRIDQLIKNSVVTKD